MGTWKQFAERLHSYKWSVTLVASCSRYGSWKLRAVSSRYNEIAAVSLSTGLPYGVSMFGFVNMMMEVGKCTLLEIKKEGFSYIYNKKDVYRASSHFEGLDSRDIFNKLLARKYERELFIDFHLIRPEYSTAIKLARSVRREIYLLFRYFTDNDLRRLSREAMGTTKAKDSSVTKLHQVIKRIVNYSDEIGETVERIEGFMKNYEAKNGKYIGKYTSFYDDSVSFGTILHEIDSAYHGAKQLAQQSSKIYY